VLVLTNLEPEGWSAAQVRELYRCRWQIERAFKRLKSLLQRGQLPKQDPASGRAWLQLKLLLALKATPKKRGWYQDPPDALGSWRCRSWAICRWC
jgi:IS4 transposase